MGNELVEADITTESKGGRSSKYDPRFVGQVRRLALLGLANTTKQLATFFGVAESTIEAWKAQFPEFSEAIRGGRVPADCIVAEKMFERAIGYEWVEEQAFKLRAVQYDPQTGKKLAEFEKIEIVEVKKKLPPDVAAIKFWLSCRQPQLWTEKQQLAVTAEECAADEEERMRLYYAKMGDNYIVPPDPKKTHCQES
jgi:hypothetical protein